MASFLTPVGMLSFPRLFVPKPPAEGAEPRYSLNLIFDKAAQQTPEFAALVQAVNECLDDKFSAGKHRDAAWLKRMKIKLPFRDCSEMEYAGYDVEDGVFIAPWSKNKPGLVNGKREDIISASDVWAGQLARCTVHPFAFDVSGNKGVSFNLNNVQIVKAKMPRLDGRKEASKEFGDTEDETDESPF